MLAKTHLKLLILFNLLPYGMCRMWNKEYDYCLKYIEEFHDRGKLQIFISAVAYCSGHRWS
jgi:hypothetical protein